MRHTPTYWADLAAAHERRDEWKQAAGAWENAADASTGHKRRDRYLFRAKLCMDNHHVRKQGEP